MPKIKLTQPIVNSASCPSGKQKIDHFDTEIPGLLLKVMPTGKRTYYVRYKDSHGRAKEKRLCDASLVSLDDVRQQAKQTLSKIELGQDPFAEKLLKRKVSTLNEFIHETYLPYIKASKKSWWVDEASLRIHIQPILGNMYMDDIKRQDVQNLVVNHSQQYKPASTNRMLTVLHRLFVCAQDWEILGISQNPAEKARKLRENNQRDRYLSQDELRNLWLALDDSDADIVNCIIKMLLLTGARKTEALQAKWADVDLIHHQWRIPENKSGKIRYVPLSNIAVDMLNKVKKFPGCEFIFPNPKTMQPYNNIFHSWDKIRNSAMIPDVRIHDLRHSYARFLANNGIPIYYVRKILGHANVATTQRYAHLQNAKLLQSSNTAGEYIANVISVVADKQNVKAEEGQMLIEKIA